MVKRFGRLTAGIVVAVAVVALPGVAFAGALEDLVGAVAPGLRGAAYWADLAAVVSAVVALAMAVVPQGAPGSAWAQVRALLDWVASNWGNAKNAPQ